MITLTKKGPHWRDWHATLEGNIYPLKDANHAEKDLYEIPGQNDPRSIQWNQIINFTFLEIPQELKLVISDSKHQINAPISMAFVQNTEHKGMIEFHWTIKTTEWDSIHNPHLIQKKILEAHDHTETYRDVEIIDATDGEFIDLFFIFYYNKNTSIDRALKIAKEYIELVQDKAEKSITSGSNNQITATFEFRSDLQGACSKYILHFIDFLKDLGIETNSDLKKRGSEILFSIEPTDSKTSLTKIKEALAIYLALPEHAAQFEIPPYSDPLLQLKFERLTAEIQSLKSNIKIQDTLITMQGLKLDNLLNTANSSEGKTPLEGLKQISLPTHVESKSEILNGFIRLGKFQKFGIEFDWSVLRNTVKKNS